MLKNHGGVFGRNPTFNNVTIEGDLNLDGQFIINGEVITGLDYNGTWNASTNTPTLASGVGTAGSLYIVSVAGTTTLDGVSNWGIGDWALFNGTTWQRVEGGADGNFVNLAATGTTTLGPATANLGVSGTTIAAGGTDTNIDVNINAKGSGVAYLNQRWGVNASGTLVPSADNTYDIGNGAVNPRDVEASRNMLAAGYQLKSGGIITESGTTRTLSASDNGKVIYCTSGSAVTITCATSLGAGFSCTIVQGGDGKVTIAAGAATLNSYSGLLSTMGKYAVVSLFSPVADTFIAAGNLGV